MDEAQRELMRELVASPHWTWLPGMQTEDGLFFLGIDKYGDFRAVRLQDGPVLAFYPSEFEGVLPNCSNEGTAAAMLVVARRAWKQPKAYMVWQHDNWCLRWPGCSIMDTPNDLPGGSEVEALAHAIIAAPLAIDEVGS